MNLTLKLAHDEVEMNRVSAVKIMNEFAQDMGLRVDTWTKIDVVYLHSALRLFFVTNNLQNCSISAHSTVCHHGHSTNKTTQYGRCFESLFT